MSCANSLQIRRRHSRPCADGAEQLKIENGRREGAKLEVERDILKIAVSVRLRCPKVVIHFAPPLARR
jgi:hypothetical protein